MSSLSLNPYVTGLKESATLDINLKALELRKQGHEVYHFGFGQSPFPVPEPIQEALRNNSHKKDYLPSRGLPELCDAVAAYYRKEFGYVYSGNDVLIGPGSKELIFQTIYLMEGPVIVPAPSWVSYGPQASLRGKDVFPINTEKDNSYKLTANELDRVCHHLGQKQKLLILNNPNNPTGAVYYEKEIKEIAEICRAYGVIVISDEIYAKIDFTEYPQSSIAKYYPEGTIVSGGLSKSFAAGGYRLGVMLIPQALHIMVDALKSIISETFSSVSAPIQFAALEAYQNFDNLRPTIKMHSDIHKYASTYLYKRFKAMGMNCPRPEGSFYLFPDFENYKQPLRAKGIITCNQLCKDVQEKAHVAMLPGADFYLPATHLGVRVASVDFDGAKALQEWPGESAMDEKKTMKLFPYLVKGCDSLEKYLKKL